MESYNISNTKKNQIISEFFSLLRTLLPSSPVLVELSRAGHWDTWYAPKHYIPCFQLVSNGYKGRQFHKQQEMETKILSRWTQACVFWRYLRIRIYTHLPELDIDWHLCLGEWGRKLFGLALIDTGNLVHSAIVSGEFWEAIGRKISNSMDYKVGIADSQRDGLQVLGIGEPWPIYLEGMEECYIL